MAWLPAAAAVAGPLADAGTISVLCNDPALLYSAPMMARRAEEEEGLHGVHKRLRRDKHPKI
jgi:hypothetical protein